MSLNLGGFVGAAAGAALGFFVGFGGGEAVSDYGNAGSYLVVGLIIGSIGGNLLWSTLQRKR